MTFHITSDDNNTTVKQFISKHTKISSKLLTRLKKMEDGIMLNDKRVTVRAILRENDILCLNTEKEVKTSDNISPVNIPLNIIFEDEYFIAFNKNAGMPTHPSHDHYNDTLANGLSYLYKQKGIPFVFRAVNRLDKDTSGVVVCAKTAGAATAFSTLQQKGLVEKKYLAIVDGILTEGDSIKGYIRRKDDSVMLREFSQTMNHTDAMYSHTDYNPLSLGTDCTLVELLLHTGRTHQIRVHMSSIGHAITGDGLYGEEKNYQRHFLHAVSVRFIHPITEKETYITANLPDEFTQLMKRKGIIYEEFKRISK